MILDNVPMFFSNHFPYFFLCNPTVLIHHGAGQDLPVPPLRGRGQKRRDGNVGMLEYQGRSWEITGHFSWVYKNIIRNGYLMDKYFDFTNEN